MSQQYHQGQLQDKMKLTSRPTTQQQKKRIQDKGISSNQIIEQLNFIEKFSSINMQQQILEVYKRDKTQSPSPLRLTQRDDTLQFDPKMTSRPRTKNCDKRVNILKSTEESTVKIENTAESARRLDVEYLSSKRSNIQIEEF